MNRDEPIHMTPEMAYLYRRIGRAEARQQLRALGIEPRTETERSLRHCLDGNDMRGFYR